jgi:aminopeptidase-like protein
MYRCIEAMYPICRSITGNGVRQTLGLIAQQIPLQIHEVPTGTPVFDWTVPKEWNIRDAYIKDSTGKRVVDFRQSNLHVMGYSVPVHRRMSLQELKTHLFTLVDVPDAIPYRTSYYNENWGFCLSQRDLAALQEPAYEVCIDASLEQGHLTYGEYAIRGQRDAEVLISCHVCHPSLCNDNLSGIALAASLAKSLSPLGLRYSYRFLFIPGTIGAITWLARNEAGVSRIKHGFILAGVGDAGHLTYKKSRGGNAEIDRVAAHVLKHSGDAHQIIDFFPYGYDERQFCSPGFDLPMGCVMRTPHGQYPEYHTSADNLDFVRPRSLADSFAKCLAIVGILEKNKAYVNLNPKCEPQLGRRGLYGAIGGQTDTRERDLAMLWVLNLSDGQHTLLEIAERSGLAFDVIDSGASALVAHGLLQER